MSIEPKLSVLQQISGTESKWEAKGAQLCSPTVEKNEADDIVGKLSTVNITSRACRSNSEPGKYRVVIPPTSTVPDTVPEQFAPKAVEEVRGYLEQHGSSSVESAPVFEALSQADMQGVATTRYRSLSDATKGLPEMEYDQYVSNRFPPQAEVTRCPKGTQVTYHDQMTVTDEDGTTEVKEMDIRVHANTVSMDGTKVICAQAPIEGAEAGFWKAAVQNASCIIDLTNKNDRLDGVTRYFPSATSANNLVDPQERIEELTEIKGWQKSEDGQGLTVYCDMNKTEGLMELLSEKGVQASSAYDDEMEMYAITVQHSDIPLNEGEHIGERKDRFRVGNLTVQCVQKEKDAGGVSAMKESRYDVKVGEGDAVPVIRAHYQGWPDHGAVSVNEFANIIKYMRALTTKVGDDKPMLIHCRAGIGRTGTVTVGLVLAKLHTEGKLTQENLYDTIDRLILEGRGQRSRAFVQSIEQYQLLLQYGEALLNGTATVK